MKIIHQSYELRGGPSDGMLLLTSWSRVWVYVDRSALSEEAFARWFLDEPEDREHRSDLDRATHFFAPDSELGVAILERMLNSRVDLAGALAELDGVYSLDYAANVLRWIQLSGPKPPADGTRAAGYQALAELALREHALSERLSKHVGDPNDALPARVRAAHPDDPDVQRRARSFGARRRRWIGG